MRFSLISDMHVNHPQPKTPYDKLEEIVVVAGDTSNGLEGLRFLQKLKNKGHDVLATTGNHENYCNLSQGRDVLETEARFREEYPFAVTKEGFRFILRNGWYYVRDEALWQSYMNDSRFCNITAHEVNGLADRDVKYVREELQKCREYQVQAVVVTHTSPTLFTLNPQYDGHYSNDWYYNPVMGELLHEYKDTIAIWCHGHTHAPADKLVGGVRVVCNPRGYPDENPEWVPMTLEI